ncbi:CAMK family protein kinase [Tritrichomonas foetus]|uniref:non-specific serine/threonine protein kinase n=1 Tax=Tritrichomonas foetus TaxID=1144522 RepID=A0A1J4K0M1_9EUKA|nr:CAMK family protein kinase [Tritrichomonas foetus]|eukprot:OHT03292.1 CAMK family protein kinase [Tritrichomonas foetus]
MSIASIPKEVGDYKLIKQIGKGHFASVWKAENTIAKQIVAVKVIECSSIDLANDQPASNSCQIDEESRNRFIREVNIIKKMDHPFICKLFDVIEKDNYTYLIMEYLENGTMLNYINSRGRICETQARRYFTQLLSALEYIHNERKTAHRDLKAENILLDKYHNIRLIDFGLSNTFTDSKPELNTTCGSPAYTSPEMIRGKPYTKIADVWSAGVLLYAMVTGTLPFDDGDIQRLLKKIAFIEPLYPSYLSPQLVDLLKKMLSKNPNERISLTGVREHSWFSQSEYLQLANLKFSMDNQWQSNIIDKEIVDELQKLGVETTKLQHSLFMNEYNSITAIYSIDRRLKITEKINDMMKTLNDPLTAMKDDASEGDSKSIISVVVKPRSRPQICRSPVQRTTRLMSMNIANGVNSDFDRENNYKFKTPQQLGKSRRLKYGRRECEEEEQKEMNRPFGTPPTPRRGPKPPTPTKMRVPMKYRFSANLTSVPMYGMT